jgi:hypothetical protein
MSGGTSRVAAVQGVASFGDHEHRNIAGTIADAAPYTISWAAERR